MNELSIHTIAYLQLHVNHQGIPKVPIRGFGQIYDIALKDLPGNSPPFFKDQRKAKNPYILRYREILVDKLKSSTAVSRFFCITDLICFIMNDAEELMKGSVQKENLFIVHNTLVLMTAKEKINWMRHNGYLHIWLIPLNGIKDGTPYAGHTVGNIPKFMRLDNLLNRDILYSLHMHSVLSYYILYGEETDEKERDMCFSYLTLREIA